eukprot:14733465-Heterocapsa_arctica.AAC.1
MPNDHPVLAWMIEYAEALVSRFEVGKDGQTPFRRNRARTTGGSCRSSERTSITCLSGVGEQLSSERDSRTLCSWASKRSPTSCTSGRRRVSSRSGT